MIRTESNVRLAILCSAMWRAVTCRLANNVNKKIRKSQKHYKIEKYKNNIKNAKTQKQQKIENYKNSRKQKNTKINESTEYIPSGSGGLTKRPQTLPRIRNARDGKLYIPPFPLGCRCTLAHDRCTLLHRCCNFDALFAYTIRVAARYAV